MNYTYWLDLIGLIVLVVEAEEFTSSFKPGVADFDADFGVVLVTFRTFLGEGEVFF